MDAPAALAVPDLTAFDAATQLVSAALYVSIALAGLAQAPRDVRTRVFAALGLTTGTGLLVPVLAWFLGVSDPYALARVPLATMLTALSVGAVLMFHFSQVFPRRRPWIRDSGLQLPIAYALTPPAIFALVMLAPEARAEVTRAFGLLFIVFGFPLLVLLGLVLPVAGILSLVRSLREASPPAGSGEPGRLPATAPARVPLAGILLSQFGGALLSILVLGPLAALAPESFAVVVVSLTVWLFGLLTPLAYAAGIWTYGVLEVPVD